MTFKHNQTVTILLVQESQESCESLLEILAPEGYKCIVAADTESAIRFCQKQDPNLVIADLDMGEISAAKFSQAICDVLPTSEVPFIFLSESSDAKLVAQARDAGGELFTTKPLDKEDFVEAVQTALWMPHLIRRHVDTEHAGQAKSPRLFGPSTGTRRSMNKGAKS